MLHIVLCNLCLSCNSGGEEIMRVLALCSICDVQRFIFDYTIGLKRKLFKIW